VSTARSVAAVIVTELRVADLRGRTVREREEAMIAIAHPEHRTELEQSRSGPSSTITVEGL
jgi:acetyl-CoA hydrolase